MAGQLQSFPFWELGFDAAGAATDPAAVTQFVNEVAAAGGPTDLFIFSHGWNNDRAAADALYNNFFAQVRRLLDQPPRGTRAKGARAGVAGVFWPSILWPDETPVAAPASGGGAASLRPLRQRAEGAADPAAVPVAALKTVFSGPGEAAQVERLAAMIATRERSDAALADFRERLRTLMGGGARPTIDDDSPELAVRAAPDDLGTWKQQLKLLSSAERPAVAAGGGGGAGLADAFDQLWAGAKGALRVASYWRMKERAGEIGARGLGPLIGTLAGRRPGLRVHLLGHSFGARLVSFALTALPGAGASPVKSLLLVQGAFSHFAFADRLPFDQARGGALRGMAARVDGPLLATFTALDTAVGRAYPLASELARQDASAVQGQASRWGAMGNDGAQAVNAGTQLLGAPGVAYSFVSGAWLNLDSNAVIKAGGPPSGAHSDIFHPETAWLALSASGVLARAG